MEHNSKNLWDVNMKHHKWIDLLRRNAVRKNDNYSLYNFLAIALCSFSYYFVRSLFQKVLKVSTWNFIGG
jgi:hypothetical protein